MNSSPFELFRRNLKPLMVLLTGLALFAFVALPVLDTYMRRNSGDIASNVVATYEGTELTRGRVDYFTRNHQATVRFLVDLAQETIRLGGFPKTTGFDFDDQNQRVTAIGINEVPSFMGSVRSLMLASLAQKDGFNLDDNSLAVWLQQFTDGKFTDRDINSRLLRSTQNRMGQPHLYEQLRTHLLAQLYEQRGISGLFAGQSPMSGPLLTPEEQWSNFLKLNRNAIVSVYGISVDDFLPETQENPSEIEIKTTYEEGKDRDPSDFSSDPGFHRRYVAKIEYVSADLQSFIDAEVAKLDEEAIRSEYERRINGGDFLIPANNPPAGLPELDLPSLDLPDVESPSESEGTQAESVNQEPADSVGNEDANSDTPSPGDAPSSDEKGPSENSPIVEEKESSTEEPTAPSVDEAPNVEEQSQVSPESAIRLVSLSQQEAEATPEGETSGQAIETQSVEKNQESIEESSVEPSTNETEPVDPATDASVTDDSSDSTESVESEEPAETVQSFEAVRDQVAADMVRPAAQARMSNALQTVKGQMKRFFSQNAMYQNSVSIQGDTGKEPPTRPDLAKLAEELGLQHEVVGPYSAVSIADEPIAQSVSMDSIQMGQSSNYVQLAFGSTSAQSSEPSLPLFAPTETTDPRTMRQYLAWKTDAVAAYTPELSEVRDEVVKVIRRREARKLAVKAAQALADMAEGKTSVELKDVLPADKAEAIQEGLGPFSWMTSFGFQGASIGVVPGIEYAGADFMKAVFTNEAGTVSVAVDQPGETVYVLQADSFQPSVEDLREQFKQPTNRFMSTMLGNGASEIVGGYFERMDDTSRFKDLTTSGE